MRRDLICQRSIWKCGIESGVSIAVMLCLVLSLGWPGQQVAPLVASFAIFMAGRWVMLEWAELEGLHEVVEDAQQRVKLQREQVRQELEEAWQEKGVQGERLQEVVDTLMSQEDRLLKGLVESKVGPVFENRAHPLEMGAVSLLGSIAGFFAGWIGFWGVWTLLAVGACIGCRRKKYLESVCWAWGLWIVVWGMVQLGLST